ncbi:hypothetical protein SUDANB108_03771 [Streptomyces sp. enrichment culture]
MHEPLIQILWNHNQPKESSGRSVGVAQKVVRAHIQIESVSLAISEKSGGE